MPEAARVDAPALPARVVEILPSALFRVELSAPGRPQATVHLAPEAGLLRVRPGDAVLVRLSPVDPGRGRIVGLP
jgi:translation initiation factor IF-1